MNRSKPTKKQPDAKSYAAALKEESECVSWRSPRPSSDKPQDVAASNEYVPTNPSSSSGNEYVPPYIPATSTPYEEYVPTSPSADYSTWKEYIPSTNPPNFPAWGGFASYSAHSRVTTQMQHDDWQNEPYFASNLKYYPHLPQPLWAGDYQTFADIKAAISAGNHSQIRPPLTQFYATPVIRAARDLENCGREDWMRMGYGSWRPYELGPGGHSMSHRSNLMNSAGMTLPTIEEGGPVQEGQEWDEEGAVGGEPLPGPGPNSAAVAGACAPEPTKNDSTPMPERISRYRTQTAAAYSMNLTFKVIQTTDSPYPIVRDNGTLIKPLPKAPYRPPVVPKKEDDMELDDDQPSTSAKCKPRSSN
ncbi:uncharacterized protein [Drosophila bipectinata]|uniref:uncharacterized protein isoform X2 n=1 Tax=Drosophila bipectinata TaxID=42026 RepID=UPI0038B2889D